MADQKSKLIAGSALAAALALAVPQIQKFEGLKHKTYPDIGGVLSICYGHTGPDVRVNTYYTTDQCYAIAEEDATKAANGVLRYSPDLINHPYILAAAISFSYNVGVGTYDKSSVARNFNAGNYKAGCTDLLKYSYVGKKYSVGLFNRRKEEYNICMKGLTDVSVSNSVSK